MDQDAFSIFRKIEEGVVEKDESSGMDKVEEEKDDNMKAVCAADSIINLDNDSDWKDDELELEGSESDLNDEDMQDNDSDWKDDEQEESDSDLNDEDKQDSNSDWKEGEQEGSDSDLNDEDKQDNDSDWKEGEQEGSDSDEVVQDKHTYEDNQHNSDEAGSSDEAIKKTKPSIKKRYKPGQRISRKCPLCNSRLKYLSQHLQRQHKLKDKLKRHQVLGKAREKEPISHVRSSTLSRRRWSYACPIKDCPAKGLKRPDVHIRTQHNIKLKSRQYKKLMQKLSYVRKRKREQRKQKRSTTTSNKECAVMSSDDVIKGFQDYTEALKGCNESAKASARAKSRTLQLLCSAVGVTLNELIKPNMPQRIVESLTTDGKRPKTINKYLLVLKQFCHYLTVYSPMARVLHCSNTTLAKTVTVTEDFISATRTGINRRQAELKAQISEIIIDPKTIRTFINQAESELSELCDPAIRMTWTRVMRLRNLIMMKIMLSQAPRTGVLTNATLGEFLNSKRTVHPETFEEVHTFLVSRHKTSQQGPATVVLSTKLEQQLMFYVRTARHLSAGCEGIDTKRSHTPLFLAANGRPVYKLAQVVQRTWTSMGLGGKFSATVVRKTAATKAVGSLTRNEADNVAQLMSHSTNTQQQYYVAAQEERDKIKACAMLSTILCRDDDVSNAKSPQGEPVHNGVVNITNTSSSSPKEVEIAPEDTAGSSSLYVSEDTAGSSSLSLLRFYGKSKQSGKKYTQNQEQIMLNTCESVKKMEPGATIVRVAKVVSEHILMKDKFTVKQISDKIRHMLDHLSKTEHIQATKARSAACSDSDKIMNVSQKEIKSILCRQEKFLKDIFTGKTNCDRHSSYKAGGIKRRNLLYEAWKGPFSDEQEEFVMDHLIGRFCPDNDTTFLDYVQKVLLPEALLKMTQDVLNISQEDAVSRFT